MSGHRVGVVVFDGVKLPEVAGPMEVFAEANRLGGTRYELLAVGRGEVTSLTGLAINVDADFTVELDTVLVAGGDRLALPSNRLRRVIGAGSPPAGADRTAGRAAAGAAGRTAARSAADPRR